MNKETLIWLQTEQKFAAETSAYNVNDVIPLEVG